MSLLERFFDVDFWKQRVKVLSCNLNQTHDKMCEANERASLLAMENEKLKAQLQTAISDCKEELYNNEVEGNMRLLEAENASNQEIYRITREKEAVATELKNTKIVFEVVVKNLESQLQAAKEAAIKQDDALHDKEQEVEKLLTEISEVVYAKELLKNALTSRDTKIAELKEQLQSAEDDFDEMAELHTGLEKAFDNLADDNVALHTQLRKTDSYKTEYKTLSEQYDKLHKVNESLTTRIAGLQLEKSTLHQRLTTEKDSLSNTLAEVVAKNEQLENRISALINDNAGLREEVIKTKFYNSQLEQETLHLSNENSRLKAENESLAKNLVEVTKTPAEFTKHCNQLKTELQTANNEIIALKEQLQSFNTERGFRATEYKILSEQYDKLHKANEALTAEIARLEQSKYPIYEKLVADKANSDQALAKLMLEKNQLDREHRALKLKYDALQSELLIKNRRLIDKVKVVEEIVKELMPVSMRFQTALFDLIEVPNVPRT